jgi:OOP family OmpA-OmpF porin
VPGERAPTGAALGALALGVMLAALAIHGVDRSAPRTAQTIAAAPAPAPVAVAEPEPEPEPEPVAAALPAPGPVAPVAAPASAEPTAPAECMSPVVLRYDHDTDELEPAARVAIRRFAAMAVERDETVLVMGHADQVGAASHNLVLSHRRAQGVASILVGNGVPRDRVVVQAYGEYQPTGESRSGNRRVEITLRGVPACPAGSGGAS